MKVFHASLVVVLAGSAWITTAAEPGRRYDVAKRASEIDPAAKEHAEIGFTFTDPKTGKPTGQAHSITDLVEGPGRLGPRRQFADTGSDGFAVDEQGNLYVTPKAAVIRVFSRDGKNLGEISLPLPAANVTFGGPDHRTLFVTARDQVFTLPIKVRGGQ